MERLTCNELKIYDGCFVNMAKREESRKYSLLIESAPTYEEIYKKLTEYENLEEQGLLLRLPCKVNDTVYVLKFEGVWRIIPHQVKTLGYIVQLIENEAIGDFVFLTQEKAEQVLSEMQQSHAEAIIDERNGR